ncbi:MAG: UbiA family prenyltransferase [Thermoleophilia bacterium]|nr:UbiA family prenyltransferase [Thermoleophilia bacterium]
MRTTSLVLRLVKFEHTIFALPFALAALLLAVDGSSASQMGWQLVLWIVVAMVGARTLAMALNRLIDARIDARNPRTASREIPSGQISRSAGVGVCVLALGLLILATTQLEPITRVLWPIPVALFLIYPYTKRFTWACHLVLGISIGLAPVGAWLATTGSLTWTPVLLGIANATWIAGFDIIYATGDAEFDRDEGLNSVPARFGIARGLVFTRVLHVVTVGALAAIWLTADLGPIYLVTVAVIAALLAWENSLVSADDLSRVNAAFFTINGIVSMVYLVGVIADLAVS